MIYKLLKSFKEYGIYVTIRKILHKLTGKPLMKKIHKIDLSKLPIMPKFEDIVSADYINNRYKKPSKIDKEILNIAWVSPPIGKGGGGHTTISRFVKYLQSHGHRITFYIYNNNTIHQTSKEAYKILLQSYHIDVSVEELENFKNQDVVFATSWETAYAVFNLKDQKLHKFYFVQDFEPMFYGVGSRYKLAEATYKFGFYGITAGKWLTKKLKSYGMESDYFDFGADIEIYQPTAPIKKKKKIAFYARAHTERRGFELGIMALQIFKERYPDYDIEFFGQDMSDYNIPFEFINRGILGKEELATIYQDSVACLLLSLTNVSLLPLELLASGCVPVMNSGENNTTVLGEIDDIAYTEAYPISLANKLCEIVEKTNINDYASEISKKYNDFSWEKSYKKVEQIIIREVINEK
ncbi:glycosyltransferase family 1 protein [Streptococcus marimammalium]|uniref:rhamnosyltransferase WsaF family glycosyltransferase n=1 Tax=Streptococcus marimammalium TaxID=269666 RepID=UPI000382CB0D|nr:glycosyltransferase family 1 protein [Streptococcus marimammalium]